MSMRLLWLPPVVQEGFDLQGVIECGLLPGLWVRHLEHLTKPVDLIEADEGAAQHGESHVNVEAAFVANGQAGKRLSQAKVRSTTQRWRPSRSLLSTPRRAMRGLMAR